MRRLRKLNCAVSPGNPSLSAQWLGDNLQWVTKAGGLSRLECADHVSPSGRLEHVLHPLQFLTFLSSLLTTALPSPEVLPSRRPLGAISPTLGQETQRQGGGEATRHNGLMPRLWRKTNEAWIPAPTCVLGRMLHFPEPLFLYFQNRNANIHLTGGCLVLSVSICWGPSRARTKVRSGRRSPWVWNLSI